MYWRSLLLALAVLILVVMVATGCQDDALEPAEQNGETETVPGDELAEENGVPDENGAPDNGGEEIAPGEPIMLDLYFMEVTDTSFELAKESREFGVFGGPQIDLEELINELLKGPETDSLSAVIPENTELRAVSLEMGIAYVDFSGEILNVSLGHEAEAVLVDSIVMTLTQLNEVEAVQILVEGEKVETISGHILIDEPLS